VRHPPGATRLTAAFAIVLLARQRATAARCEPQLRLTQLAAPAGSQL
jgi:hypothetical protein